MFLELCVGIIGVVVERFDTSVANIVIFWYPACSSGSLELKKEMFGCFIINFIAQASNVISLVSINNDNFLPALGSFWIVGILLYFGFKKLWNVKNDRKHNYRNDVIHHPSPWVNSKRSIMIFYWFRDSQVTLQS